MGKFIKSGERKDFYASGGSGKMFGKGTAHSAVSGVSGKPSNDGTEGSEPASRPYESESYTKGVRYLKGGSGKMFGKGHAGKVESGQSGKSGQ